MALNLKPDRNAAGVLVTIEGGDGSGKSTHVKFLAQLLEKIGLEVVCVREPGGTLLGEQLRSIVLDPSNEGMSDRAELLIYEAARAQLVDEVIKPALARGAVVICDRFTDSTIVYQGYGRGIDITVIEALNDFATSGITPDITIVFKCPDAEEEKDRVGRRGSLDRLESAGDDFHKRVFDGFNDISMSTDSRIRLIETSGLHSQTAKQVFEALGSLLPFLIDDSIDFTEDLKAYDAEHDHSKDEQCDGDGE